MTADHRSGDLADLLRWQDDGGTWVVLEHFADAVVISLLTCGGDEEMARLTSRDPVLLAYLHRRPSSADADPD